MSWLGLLSSPTTLLWGAAGIGVVAISAAGYHYYKVDGLEDQIYAVTKERDAVKLDLSEKMRMAAIAYAAQITNHRRVEQELRDDNARIQERSNAEAEKYRAVIVARDSVVGRLSKRIAALAAGARLTPEGTPAPASCDAAIQATDLLGRMLERTDQAAGVIARYADEVERSASACISAYESVLERQKSLMVPAAAASAPV